MGYYDKDGNEIDLRRWSILFSDRRYQVVKQTEVGSFTISTVWLGIDHGFGRSEKPIIFETMIFNHDKDDRDFLHEQHRYASLDSALAHHEELVVQARLLEEFMPPRRDSFLSRLRRALRN